MLLHFSDIANAVAATSKKSEKERIVADYLRELDDSSLERAVVFFTGSPFPRSEERVTGVGWSTLADSVAEATGAPLEAIFEASHETGDLGDAVARFFPPAGGSDPSMGATGLFFDELASTQGTIRKRELLTQFLRPLGSQSARFVAKILLAEFRIGLQQGLVESAIARAFERPLVSVRRAHMFTGDLGATALLARAGTLEGAAMQLFRPFELMLAQPEESAAAIVDQLGSNAIADDKYDGIRAQLHCDGSEARLYSRTLDDVSARFPEVIAAGLEVARRFLLDGELVAWRHGILPFAEIQKRLGRRTVSAKLLESVPVVFFAFDLLYLDGVALFEHPLHERLSLLRSLLGGRDRLRLADQGEARDAAHLDELFDDARRRGNEGLVVKGIDSVYTPGRRGKSWLKYKKALATLDCVVTAAEYGHGKRRGVLSDYTFAVRRGDDLLNIGKAYSGLTDAEIDLLTSRFQSITISRHGPVHLVDPVVVLEIAFDRIQESGRHKSGFALRFPRIARIREDKTAQQISTLDEVRAIYESQLRRERDARS